MPKSDLKVLMVSSDRKILEPGSAVAERMREYAGLVEELYIILLSGSVHDLKETQLDKNLWVYPTNSSNRWWRSGDAARIGKRLVREKKFVRGKTIVTSQDPFECGLAALKVKRKWRLPLEVQLHTDPFSPYFTGFLNTLRKRIAKKVLKNADSIRVVSEYLKLQATSYKLEAQVTVLPIFVDKNKIEDGVIKFDVHARFGWHFVILCVGRLEVEKNYGLALEILAMVRTKYPDTGIVFVGSGREEASLKRKAEKLGLDKHAVFTGWQSDLASFYRTSNMLLVTSDYEGYGMTLVEAGLSGLPVVTTPVGFALELEHGKDAYIYPSGSPELFSQGIIELIETNAKREYLRTNMRATLESKLITKEEYLRRMLESWNQTALKITE